MQDDDVESAEAFAQRLWFADLEERSHLMAWMTRELQKRDAAVAARARREVIAGGMGWLGLTEKP